MSLDSNSASCYPSKLKTSQHCSSNVVAIGLLNLKYESYIEIFRVRHEYHQPALFKSSGPKLIGRSYIPISKASVDEIA